MLNYVYVDRFVSIFISKTIWERKITYRLAIVDCLLALPTTARKVESIGGTFPLSRLSSVIERTRK